MDFSSQVLDLRAFMSASGDEPAVPPVYDLVGVINHVGESLGDGHYTCQVNDGDTWWTCNDSRPPAPYIGRVGSKIRAKNTTPYVLVFKRREE